MKKRMTIACLTMMLLASAAVQADEWQPGKGKLMTRWAKDVTPDKVLPEYPRPQFVRKDWQNLNGLWDYAIRPAAETKPEKWDGKILVPFAAESALSGVMKTVGTENRLWYRRTFTVPAGWTDKHVLLHFGAVDWDTTVWVNGKEIGKHRGGYDPFTFDLADSIKPGSENEIIVSVWDPTDGGEQARGKQVAKPRGIWYTPVTGIWQTVWIEPVPKKYARSVKIVPNVDAKQVEITLDVVGGSNVPDASLINVTVTDGGKKVGAAAGPSGTVRIDIPDAKLWTPETPHLYELQITLDGGDAVTSYFAMRKSSMAKDDKGTLRLMLNDKPVFQVGPLDQGWWPDGLYTAPTDEALKYDIEITKKFGFNMARKHVKVEPARWYYWADKLGLIVWQDMPSGYSSARPFTKWDAKGTHDNTEGTRDPESSKQFETELKAMIDSLHNHPSIVMWVPFNEGWGQYDTVRVTNWVKQYDPTRLVNCASGGNDFPVGDVIDLHIYPGPAAPPKPDGKRALVLGEFGGLGLPVEGHIWQQKDNWGYRTYKSQEELARNYVDLYTKLHPLIDNAGLSAAIYTQTTDVEGEVNGLLTYDREVVKIPAEVLHEIHSKLSTPATQEKPK